MSTYSWEQRNQRGRAATEQEQPSFTPEEIVKLAALQARSRSIDIELGLDERRLKFARWLVDHGRLSEGLP